MATAPAGVEHRSKEDNSSKISRKRRKEERLAATGGSGSSSLDARARGPGHPHYPKTSSSSSDHHHSSNFGDYSAAGEFEGIWGEDSVQYRLANGGGGGVGGEIPKDQSPGGGGTPSPGGGLHVAHCELHSPRDAELLRLDQLDSHYDQQQQKLGGGAPGDMNTGDRDTYAAMMQDNYHNPVPPPLPRRHVR